MAPDTDTAVDLRESVRQQARETYRQSLAAEMPLTGRRLGEMFERSDRWGRDRIAEVRREDDAAEGGPDSERQPDAAPDSADGGGDSEHGAATARSGASPLTSRPLPPPALGPWIARAAPTAPDAGTPQPAAGAAPKTEPSPPSPGVSAAIRRTTAAAVMVVAAVAGVVSFAHMHDLAVKAGEGWRAWVLPLAVDGLIIAASMTMLVRRRQGKNSGVLAWCSLSLGIVASLAANVAAAAPTWEGRVVAAWPPLALLLSYELLMQQVRDTRTPEK